MLQVEQLLGGFNFGHVIHLPQSKFSYHTSRDTNGNGFAELICFY